MVFNIYTPLTNSLFLYILNSYFHTQQVMDHSINDDQKVMICSINVKSGVAMVKQEIQAAEDVIGKCVDVLVNCAGN